MFRFSRLFTRWFARPGHPGIRRRPPSRRRHQAAQLAVETLEDRAVPTVLFQPVFGAQDTSFGSGVMHTGRVLPIFWGSYWGSHPDQVAQIANRTADVSEFSPGNHNYLSGLRWYGNDHGASIYSYYVDTESEPPSSIDGAPFGQPYNEINRVVYDLHALADPTTFSETPIYVVFTPPGVGSPGAYGFNEIGWHLPDLVARDQVWVSTTAEDGSNNFDLDHTTRVYSHELVEAITDAFAGYPFLSGIEVTKGAGFPSNTSAGKPEDQIGDNEPNNNYVYRIDGPTGPLVQAYWSAADQQYYVGDGNSLTMQINPNPWMGSPLAFTNGTLVINANQYATGAVPLDYLGNQVITLGSVDMPEGKAVQVIMDGQTFDFQPGKISDIVINSANEHETITVNGTLPNVPVTMNLGPDQYVVNLDATSAHPMAAEVTVNSSPAGQVDVRLNGSRDWFNQDITVHGNGAGTQLSYLGSGVASLGALLGPGYGNIPLHSQKVLIYSGVNTLTLSPSTGSIGKLFLSGSGFAAEHVLVTDAGTGSIALDGTTINYAHVAELEDEVTVPSATYDFTTPGSLATPAVSVVDGPVLFGHHTTSLQQTYVFGQGNFGLIVTDPVNFANKTNVTVRTDNLSGEIDMNLAYPDPKLDSLTLDPGLGFTSVNVAGTPSAVATTVKNSGLAGDVQTVTLGTPAQGVLNLVGPVTVQKATANGPGTTKLIVDDSADPFTRHATLDTITLGPDAYGRISGLAWTPIQYRYADTATVTVQTGTGVGTTTTIKATGTPVKLIAHASGAVTVGDAGSMAHINADLTISDPPSGAFLTLEVDDSADPFAHNVNLSTVTIASNDYGKIDGLSQGTIRYRYADTSDVTVETGTVPGSVVNVLATVKPVSLMAHADATVNVGNAGSVQQITGDLTISDPPIGAHVNVNVNDYSDGTLRPNVVLETAPNPIFGRITGLTTAPAVISYRYIDTANLTLQTGTGGATVNVRATGSPVSLIGHANGTVNVGDAGNLQQINAPLSISDPPAYVTLNIDDSADMAGRTMILSRNASAGSLAVLGQATITWAVADVSAINLNLGLGSDTVFVRALGNALTINSAGDSSADTINLGSVANTLGSITSPVNLIGGAADQLTFNDQATTANRAFTVDGTSVSWTGGPQVHYTGFSSVTVNGGTGTDSYQLNGTSPTALLTVNGGGSKNTAVGSPTSNIWYLPATNQGIIFGPAYPTQPAFHNMQNLKSSPVGDDYEFAGGAGITGNLLGSGHDLLDYRLYSTSVIVDLRLSAATTTTGIGGFVKGIYAVFGGTVAPANAGVYNLLIGNGNNYLVGGTGRRNILVAGSTPSQLLGGDGEDLMITGTTVYDTTLAGLNTWKTIAAYWAGSDDFATRSAHLLAGTGVPLLDATRVTGNGSGNHLTGQHDKVLLYNDGIDALAAVDFLFTQLVPIAP
jgi:hypothetical protein